MTLNPPSPPVDPLGRGHAHGNARGRADRTCSRLAAWLVLTLATSGLLVWMGKGSLHVPLSSPGEARAWIDQAAPELVAMAALRLVALLCAAYLAGLLLTAWVVTALGRPGAARRLLRLAPRMVRRVLLGGAGASLLAQATLAPGAAWAAPPDEHEPVAVMIRLAPEEDGAAATSAAAEAGGEPVPAADTPGEAPADADSHNAAADSGTWVVHPGDSFWSIAAQMVEDGRDDDIGRYWQDLIALNREHLADPDNPDLLIPGQELTLPVL